MIPHRSPIRVHLLKQNHSLNCQSLKIPVFDNNDVDPFAFMKFSTAFRNAVACQPGIPDGVIFMYLKNNLKGRALSLVHNLPNDSVSYTEAWKLLESTFLDKNRTLFLILNHKKCTTLEENVAFLEQLRSRALDLERLDLSFEDGKLSDKMLNLIIRNKLSATFMMELVRKVGGSYPSVREILDNNCSSVSSLLKGVI